jgi:DNA-binding NarL/FixJ family response regulator
LLGEQQSWTEAVERVLARVDVSVVATATAAQDTLELLDDHESELLIAEIGTPGGLDFLRAAVQRRPQLKVVVLSSSRDPELVHQSLGAGAVAYVVKSVEPDDLATAVRQSFDRSVYLAENGDSARDAERSANGEVAQLTGRQLEILRLVADGRSNSEVARILWVTEQTVKFHLCNVYRKLGVTNRTEASRWAQVHGLLAAPQG